MSNPTLPVLTVGPAIVSHNSKAYYSKTGIKSELQRETFQIKTDFDGTIDERMKSQMTIITMTPDGQITNLNKYFPFAAADVGKSIFTTSALPLVIKTKFGGTSNLGQTITFPRAAVFKLPPLFLGTQKTLFGDMTFVCIGVPTVQSNVATAWQTIVSATFSDTSFDETKIVTDSYTAAYGASPYDVIGSLAGFELNLAMETANIYADDYGITDIILQSLTASAKFAPSNLTETQMSTLLAAQGTGYVFPGQSLSKSATDLVIVGSGNGAVTLTATIKNAGPKSGSYMYSTDKHRLDAIEFTSKATWTTGARNEPWVLAVA